MTDATRADAHRGDTIRFGANGLVESIRDSGDRVLACTRNAEGRAEAALVEAIDYEYDAKGQRTARHSGLASVAETPFEAEYDAADRMRAVTLHPDTGHAVRYRLQYDANGRLVEKSNEADATDTTRYRWDARGRLVEIESPGVTARFGYDAFGRRIERSVNGETVRALYDGPQLIAELAGGSIDTTYLTGLAIDEMLARHTDAGARTYLTDALGSVIGQTGEDQSAIGWYAYSPYGEVVAIGEDEANPVQYTGRENDASGLYYYRARYYDPVLKRFISEDPIGLDGGINTHAYVQGNPVSYIDPEGLRGSLPVPMLRPQPLPPGAMGAFPYIRPEYEYELLQNRFLEPQPNLVCTNWACPFQHSVMCPSSNPTVPRLEMPHFYPPTRSTACFAVTISIPSKHPSESRSSSPVTIRSA